MEDQIKELLSNYRMEVMLEFEGICEEVMLKKCTNSEFVKFQSILDEAQSIFEKKN